MKRIVTQWLAGGYLVCQRGTHRGQVLYEVIAEKACERIYNAISARLGGERRVLAVTDPYNAEGSTADVSYRTAKTTLWPTDDQKCHVNWAVCDLSWEMEFCRVVEAEPRVEAYVKNAGLGFEVPYRFGGESHRYLPDFIVRVRDGAGQPVHVVVEIKGQPDEQSKTKSETMRGQWVPGVSNLGEFGRWEFLELRDINTMAADFRACINSLLAESEAA